MSYDLAVFDVDVAPRDAFGRWFEEQTAWDGDRKYDDPGVASQPLRAWLAEMTRWHPSLNPSAPRPVFDPSKEREKIGRNEYVAADDSRVGDYVIGPAVIYVAFGWSQADRASRRAVVLAAKHGVGFFDVSGDGEPIWSADELRRKAAELDEAAKEEAEAEASGGGVVGYRRRNAKLRWLVTALAFASIVICVLLWTGAIRA